MPTSMAWPSWSAPASWPTASRMWLARARRCPSTSHRESEAMPEGALQRAVELLGRLGEQPAERSVADLASDAGIPTSTAYRLLAELEQHGLVQRGAERTVAL